MNQKHREKASIQKSRFFLYLAYALIPFCFFGLLFIWFGAGVTLFFLVFLLPLYFLLHSFFHSKFILPMEEDWLNQYGIRTLAKIVSHEVREFEDDNGRLLHSYFIHLSWQDPRTGKEYTTVKRTSLPPDTWRNIEEVYPLGTHFTVQFDPDDPSFFLIKDLR